MTGVSHANYKGYDDVTQAQMAYMIRYSLGLVHVVKDGNGTDSDTSTAPSSIVPRHPTEEQVYEALEHASNTFLGREWLVVFRGTRPGIYLSWYVSNYLPQSCSPNTSVQEFCLEHGIGHQYISL